MTKPKTLGVCFCCLRNGLTAPILLVGADGRTGLCNDCFDDVVKAGIIWRSDLGLITGSIHQNAATTLRLQ